MEGVVNISQDYAKRVFGPPRTRLERKYPQPRIMLREALMDLNQKSSLPFRLEEVVTDSPLEPTTEGK